MPAGFSRKRFAPGIEVWVSIVPKMFDTSPPVTRPTTFVTPAPVVLVKRAVSGVPTLKRPKLWKRFAPERDPPVIVTVVPAWLTTVPSPLDVIAVACARQSAGKIATAVTGTVTSRSNIDVSQLRMITPVSRAARDGRHRRRKLWRQRRNLSKSGGRRGSMAGGCLPDATTSRHLARGPFASRWLHQRLRAASVLTDARGRRSGPLSYARHLRGRAGTDGEREPRGLV